ncbi:GLTT repeat protein [Prochlorococcus marinus]|uniref:GLTT repeat (6 copies) n=1 Tax=Prochlorococcus marinus str. SB TaxID=59926 RepID=A0A0A2B218_PROMR|nr:GLTT repeat protein [Prochlorococcus marinus]KGG07906.1 hypothetical protein EV02_0574 [Prochlorococcus marinus str. SB]
MGINKGKGNQHCGTKPKKIAFGIAPLGIVSIGIVPMGVISIGVVPMGVFSFGAVAMGIVNLSVVGMGIISAGVTTMGIWEYSPSSHNNHHNHSKQISNSNKENMMLDLFNTKKEAEEAASKYGCFGAHKMGNKWMPCKMH